MVDFCYDTVAVIVIYLDATNLTPSSPSPLYISFNNLGYSYPQYYYDLEKLWRLKSVSETILELERLENFKGQL